MKKIKDIIGISLICAVALQPKVSFGETNNTILKEGSSPKLMYNGKTSNREILLGAPYESQSILNANSYSLEKYDEYVGTPYTRSVLYETRSLTPVTSYHGAWAMDGNSYKDGNIFWARVGSLFGVGLTSYLPRSSGLYPNYAQIDLWDGTTSRILTSDYNGSTHSYRCDDNLASEFTLDSALAEWHNDTLYDWNSLNARFYIIPKVHGKSYELWSRTARGENVGSWLNSGVIIKTDGIGPKTTFLNDQPYTWISASSYDLKTSVVDEDSGAHRQRYFTTGAQPSGDWEEGTLNMTITITEQGRTGVSILGIDKAGNSTQTNTYVLLDNINPTISVSGNPTSLCSSATLVVKASDNTNGGGIAYVVLPDGTKKTMEPETFNSSINYTVDRNGTYTFEVYDQAGNKATQTVNVTNIADTVSIPDPNLRAGIEKILGKASGAEIFKSELATIRDIILKGKGIVNLEGLQYCTNLRQLDLSSNKVADVSQIANLQNLELVYLPDNLLTDSAVNKLKSLPVVTDLVLNGNKLTKVPDFVYSYKKLAHLNLDNNNISGAIPSNLGNISTLVDLRLSQNNFTGSIPTSFGNLKKLKCLWLSFNNLSGSIPKELANMTSLVDLMLHNNSLTGTIPAELSNAPNLKVLSFKNNKLYGEIPSSIGSMNLDKNTGTRYTGTYYTDFSNNLLIGDVPSTLLSKIDKDKFDKNLIRNGTTNQKQLVLNGEASATIGLQSILDVSNYKKNVKIKNTIDSTVSYEEVPSAYEIIDLNRDSNYLDSSYKAIKNGTTSLKFGIKNYYNNNTYATTSNQLAITILSPDVYLDVGNFRNYEYADPNEANTYWVKVGNSFNFDVNSFTLKSTNVYPNLNRINLQNGSINRRVDSNSNADSNFTSHFTLNKVVNQKTQTTDYNFLISYFTITPNVHGETYEGLFTGGYSSSLPSEKSINQKIKTDGQGPTSGSSTTTSGRGSFSVSVPNITDNNQSGLKEVKFTVYQTANPSDKIDITEPFTTEGGTLNVTFNNSKLGSIYNSNNTEYTIEIRLYDNVGNSTYQAKRTATILPNLEIFDGATYLLDKDNYPDSTDGLHPYKVSDSLYWVRTGAPFKIYREISMPGYTNTYPDTTYIQMRDSTNNNTISHKTSNFSGAYKNFTPTAHNDGTTSNFVMGSNSSDKLTLSSGGYYFNISTFEITALKNNATYNIFTKAALDGSIETQFKDRQIQVKTDGTAPTIDLSYSTDWAKDGVEILVDVTDLDSGVAELKWSYGKKDISYFNQNGEDIPEDEYWGMPMLYATENGWYTVYARDNVGNESIKYVEITNIDRNLPTITGDLDNDWVKGDKVIAFTATDQEGGASSIKLWNESKTSVLKTGTISNGVGNLVYTVTTEGVTRYKIVATDRVLNERTSNVTVRIDNTAPVATIIAPSTTQNRTVEISLENIIDIHSGAKEVLISENKNFTSSLVTSTLTGLTSKKVNYTLEERLVASEDYTDRTIYIRIVDKVGNYTDYSKTITLLPNSDDIITTIETPKEGELILNGNAVVIRWSQSLKDGNKPTLPQLKAEVELTHKNGGGVGKDKVYKYTVNGNTNVLRLENLDFGEYEVKVKSYYMLEPEVYSESQVRKFRYNFFKGNGNVITKKIEIASPIKFLSISTESEIPNGTKIEGYVYYSKLDDGSVDKTKYKKFEITRNPNINNIIELPSKTNTIWVEYKLTGSITNNTLTPFLDTILVRAR